MKDDGIKRIGVLLIHGIGDQQKHEHLNAVAQNFIDMACLKYGNSKVSVTAHPGYENRSPLSIHISSTNIPTPDIQLDFHEVWWRDLGDDKTFGRIIRFWAWALSISGTRGQFATPTSDFSLPKNKSSNRKRVGFSNRMKLFFTTTYFFVMLTPIWLLTNIIKIIPGLPRIRLFDAVFSYMSSVKLYQDLGDNLAGTLEDFDQPRRFSIQRKVHQAIVNISRQNYDHWYIAGHSLGSVIGFKALFSGDHGFARLLSRNFWEKDVPNQLKYSSKHPAPYPDEPKCPNWLSPQAAINTKILLERCAGFISWGSPLETFAHTWPATIPISNTFSPGKDFEWINVYDAADLVASPLSSFQNLNTSDGRKINPINISSRSHSFIGFAHTHYLRADTLSNQKDRVGFTLLEWMIGPVRNFKLSSEKTQLEQPNSAEEIRRKFGIGVQAVIALCLGLILWPRATALLMNFVRKIPHFVLGIIDQNWVQAYDKKTIFLEHQLDDPTLSLDPSLDLRIIAYTGVALFLCAIIHYIFVKPKNSVIHSHHEKNDYDDDDDYRKALKSSTTSLTK